MNTRLFRFLVGLSALSASVLAEREAFLLYAADGAAKVDEKLLLETATSHERLARNVLDCSGTMIRWRGALSAAGSDPFSPVGLKEESRCRFYVKDKSYRLEYLAIPPAGQDKTGADTVTEVLVETPQTAYKYNPVSATGAPYATLFRYRDPETSEVHARIAATFRAQLHSLFAPGGAKIADMLQRSEVNPVAKRYDDVPNALVIAGSLDVPLSGSDHGVSEFEFVLDRDNESAARRFKVATIAATWSISVEGRIRAARIENSALVPKEIATEYVFGKSRGVSPMDYREVVQIDYGPAPVDEKLFTEAGFAGLKHDYTVVDVDQKGLRRIGKTIEAAPPESHLLPSGSPPAAQPSMVRTIFLIFNVVLALIVGVVILFLWRRRAGRKSGQALPRGVPALNRTKRDAAIAARDTWEE